MSLPPQILRVKRKIDDTPVDTLYVETNLNKRRLTDEGYLFRRFLDEQPRSETAHPQIPLNLPTKPGRELSSTGESHGGSTITRAAGADARASDSSQRVDIPSRSRRTYKIVKPSHMAAIPSARDGRRQKTRDQEIAVVMEERSTPRPREFQPQSVSEKTPNTPTTLDSQHKLSSFKKPGKTARLPDNIKRAFNPRNDEVSQELQEALQNFALEHELASADDSRTGNIDGDATAESKQDMSGIHDAEDNEMPEEDQQYIYDTYLRHSCPLPSTDMDITANHDDEVGRLVIQEEDEPVWQWYGEDETPSEGDWDSDQDDENAENYYGADYPDDDTDSENDGGSDMIGHHRHSEDEGFESDDASGSDDHGEKYSIRGYSSFSQEDRSEMLDYIRD